MIGIEKMLNLLIYEPADEVSAREVKEFLNLNYPEAEWMVTVKNNRLDIRCEFASAEEETFYMLKWS